MSAKNKASELITEFNRKLQELNNTLSEVNQRAEELQLEINYINEKELPEAVEARVLTGDSTLENKVKKTLDKCREELQGKLESIPVLSNAIKRVQLEYAEKAVELERLVNEELRLEEQTRYAKMMYQKKVYVDTIIEESKELQNLNNLVSQLQELQVKAGLKNNVYNSFEFQSASNNTSVDNFNGVYLPLDYNEVKRLVTGQYSSRDVEYLNRFSDKKNL